MGSNLVKLKSLKGLACTKSYQSQKLKYRYRAEENVLVISLSLATVPCIGLCAWIHDDCSPVA
jgi:hypothetical protein